MPFSTCKREIRAATLSLPQRRLKMLKATLLRNVCMLAVTVLFSSSATFLFAQQINVAQAAGQITDSSGAVIPGVTVTLTEVDRGVSHKTVTDSNGRYIMPGLPVGSYQLRAQ